jgi:hypothetical protein
MATMPPYERVFMNFWNVCEHLSCSIPTGITEITLRTADSCQDPSFYFYFYQKTISATEREASLSGDTCR